MPDKFAQRTAALQGCELVSSVAPVLERLKKLEAGTDKSLKIMVSQARVEEEKILAIKASGGIEVRTIVGKKNTVSLREVMESKMQPRDKLRSAKMIKAGWWIT